MKVFFVDWGQHSSLCSPLGQHSLCSPLGLNFGPQISQKLSFSSIVLFQSIDPSLSSVHRFADSLDLLQKLTNQGQFQPDVSSVAVEVFRLKQALLETL